MIGNEARRISAAAKATRPGGLDHDGRRLGHRVRRAALPVAAAALGILLFAPGAALALSGGPEIPINTTTAGNQNSPAIAPDPGGGFTVAWTSDEQDGDGSGVYARRFDAAGEPLGGEIAINTTTAGNQNSPAIAPDPGGGFTVAWTSDEQDGSGSDVYARRFDAAGEPLGGEIAVNASTAGDQFGAVIASDGSGGFTAAWASSGYEEWGGITFPVSRVYARRFDATGAPLGGEILVGSGSGGFFSLVGLGDPAIATDGSGGFTVAWHRLEASYICPPGDYCYPGPFSYYVYARRFDAAGSSLGGAIQVNATTTVGQFNPAIAPDGSGGFTVTWAGNGLGDADGVYERRLDAAGDPVWDPSAVNLTTAGRQYGPAIAPDGDGGFTVAWTSDEQDGDGSGVYARRFATDLPDTRIDSGPSGPTNDSTPTFAFHSDEESASFECRLDGGTVSACSSPHTTAPLPDGEHSFEVRAIGEAGKIDPVPASRSFDVDTEPPDTQITCGPYDCSYSSPGYLYFGFSSSEEGSSFECRHFAQGGTPPAFHHCFAFYYDNNYYHYLGSLPDGDYTFEVRAVDTAGNPDPTPTARDFTFDATPPDTRIDSGPADGARTSNDSPGFGFSSPDGDVNHFSCRLTGPGAPLDDDPCQSPRNYTDLADGAYTFSVRATDGAGNLGPASERSFTVDTVAPETQITFGPAGPTKDTTPIFAFSSEAGARFECRLDGGGYSACSSPRPLGLLSDGPHSFEVRATDAAGNSDPSPASRSFTVDTLAPNTQITSGPAGPTDDPTPSFAFSSNEAGAGFECRLDGGGYSACASPQVLAPLADGPHSFEVRATDQVGNTDPTPASRSFTVNTAAAAPPASPPSANPPPQVRRLPALATLPPNTVPPRAKLFGKRRQEAGKPIEIVASCAEDCGLLATGRVVVWGAPHRGAARAARRPKARFGLRKAARQLSAGQVATLRLRPKSGKARRRLRRLVRRGRKAQAKIRVSYRDRAGNASTAKLTIGLRRR